MTLRGKLITWTLIALFAWFVLTQPANAAGAVGEAFSKLGDAADSVLTFLTALFK
jgi:hypothetical protein